MGLGCCCLRVTVAVHSAGPVVKPNLSVKNSSLEVPAPKVSMAVENYVPIDLLPASRKGHLSPSILAAGNSHGPSQLPNFPEASVDSETVQHKLVRDIMHPDELTEKQNQYSAVIEYRSPIKVITSPIKNAGIEEPYHVQISDNVMPGKITSFGFEDPRNAVSPRSQEDSELAASIRISEDQNLPIGRCMHLVSLIDLPKIQPGMNSAKSKLSHLGVPAPKFSALSILVFSVKSQQKRTPEESFRPVPEMMFRWLTFESISESRRCRRDSGKKLCFQVELKKGNSPALAQREESRPSLAGGRGLLGQSDLFNDQILQLRAKDCRLHLIIGDKVGKPTNDPNVKNPKFVVLADRD